ncbi:MAG: SWIM zinc finger family protein, partial [Cohnella sp.]|nr:SWIM zinc finger family protein [Cohnella sp.]
MASNREQVKFQLDRKTVERLCTEAVTRQGEAIIRGGQVSSLKADAAFGGVTAVVKSNTNKREEVEIVWDGTQGIEASCSCDPYAATGVYCPHIAAVLIAMANDTADDEDEPIAITDRDSQLTKQVIYLFDRDLTRQSELQLEEESIPEQTQELDVEFACRVMQGFSSRPMLAVTMKIGVSRLYIVQRMKDFLHNVDNRNPMVFAKYFTC